MIVFHEKGLRGSFRFTAPSGKRAFRAEESSRFLDGEPPLGKDYNEGK